MNLPGLIIFDWAGTLVDFGCCAPLTAFHRAFENAGLPISDEIARRPMGAHKRDHVREILHYAEIANRVRNELKREPDATLVQAIYDDFARLLPAELLVHAAPIPGAVEALHWLLRAWRSYRQHDGLHPRDDGCASSQSPAHRALIQKW